MSKGQIFLSSGLLLEIQILRMSSISSTSLLRKYLDHCYKVGVSKAFTTWNPSVIPHQDTLLITYNPTNVTFWITLGTPEFSSLEGRVECRNPSHEQKNDENCMRTVPFSISLDSIQMWFFSIFNRGMEKLSFSIEGHYQTCHL